MFLVVPKWPIGRAAARSHFPHPTNSRRNPTQPSVFCCVWILHIAAKPLFTRNTRRGSLKPKIACLLRGAGRQRWQPWSLQCFSYEEHVIYRASMDCYHHAVHLLEYSIPATSDSTFRRRMPRDAV